MNLKLLALQGSANGAGRGRSAGALAGSSAHGDAAWEYTNSEFNSTNITMSSLSFNTAADQKNWVTDRLPAASSFLSAGCAVGTVASFVFPPVAPVATGVCVASKVASVGNEYFNKKK
jgi:hypothetical protein